eukprot:gnl/MRDRNA2_/MRDRNA2_103202_c0_seq1.p1 gnl/MRDRNA2_/MRDRNA2_103202_c0~~gnl/MRDRNA2_/MRDRNA2_103202_c0_seq1.p1  ORF type:complete len:182 (-),score=40.80 gnl/MRDRNA2_/MRDRNA2_103202_c0_seq1:201-746(-)
MQSIVPFVMVFRVHCAWQHFPNNKPPQVKTHPVLQLDWTRKMKFMTPQRMAPISSNANEATESPQVSWANEMQMIHMRRVMGWGNAKSTTRDTDQQEELKKKDLPDSRTASASVLTSRKEDVQALEKSTAAAAEENPQLEAETYSAESVLLVSSLIMTGVALNVLYFSHSSKSEKESLLTV